MCGIGGGLPSQRFEGFKVCKGLERWPWERLPSQRFKGFKLGLKGWQTAGFVRVWSVGLGGGLPSQRFKGFKLFKRLRVWRV